MLMFFFFYFFFIMQWWIYLLSIIICAGEIYAHTVSSDLQLIKSFFFFGSLSSNLFLVLDICSSIRSTQFSCLLFEEAAREGWWYDMSIVKLVLSHYLFIFYFIHASFFAVINAGVAGCCTGLALSFPGIQCLM
jgi:hypothetical protein